MTCGLSRPPASTTNERVSSVAAARIWRAAPTTPSRASERAIVMISKIAEHADKKEPPWQYERVISH